MQKAVYRIIRKFPKLHLLDYIFLGILFIIASVFLVLRITRQNVWVPVEIELGSQDAPWNTWSQNWYASSLKRGDTAFNSFGQKTAEILNIQNIDVGGSRVIYVTINLKATYNHTAKTYSFDFQPLVVGGSFNETFLTQNVSGVITFVGDNKPYQEKIIETRLLYVYPWVASALYKGLQAKDLNGTVVAEIQNFAVQNSQRYEFRDLQGRTMVIPGEDPERKDVTMRLKIFAKEYNGVYYFTGQQIKIGNGLHLEFPNVSAQYMEISAIIQ